VTDERLSRHFVLSEFEQHDGTPVPAFAIPPLRQLCRILLEPLRERFGATVVMSGYRTATYNARVGGAPMSFHIYKPSRPYAAADVVPHLGSPAEWYELLDRLGAGGLGLYRGHVHVDNRPGRARWSSGAQ
jgi:uncharacterized protein YcbK (DUF882 family)